MIMQVSRVALITLSKKLARLSVPLHQASPSAPVDAPGGAFGRGRKAEA